MKVKFFVEDNCDGLEKLINDFIKDKIVVDIKFQAYKLRRMALIMYDEPLMYELHLDKGRPRAEDETD